MCRCGSAEVRDSRWEIDMKMNRDRGRSLGSSRSAIGIHDLDCY